MSKIYYEKRERGFECVGVTNDGGDILRFIFDIPLEGSLVIGERVCEKISGGICSVNLSQIAEGECKPSVYKSGRHYNLESILIGKGVSIKSPDDEYIRELGKDVFLLKEKFDELTDRIKFIETAINGKPII